MSVLGTSRAIAIRHHLVRGVLDGTVTALVAVVEARPTPCLDAAGAPAWSWRQHSGRANRTYGPDDPDYRWPDGLLQFSPYGDVGSSLWVREDFTFIYSADRDQNDLVAAAADGERVVRYRADPDQERYEWTPAALMPQWASRVTLKITGLAVVQLSAVTDEIIAQTGCASRAAFRRDWNATHRGPNRWTDDLWCWQLQWGVRRVRRRVSLGGLGA